MALVIKETKDIQTVGDLVKTLIKFPIDMPLERPATVYQAKPEKGEYFKDRRGHVTVQN